MTSNNTHKETFGPVGHRGVPLVSSWGIHIGISYQRPGWQQQSLDYVKREGIDRYVKWGANLVELYPANKEAHFGEYDVQENSATPMHTFREHSDADQVNKWTLDEFLDFNRHAHANDFLVTWMIHCWWPLPVPERARALWRLLRQLGQDVGDVGLDGFDSSIDGYFAEGDFLMPAAANDQLWPYHPGMYVREAAWGLNSTAANFIQPRGFHLTDGRVLMYEREDYMGLAPECWRGREDVWRGRDVQLRHGRLFVSLQAEGRDMTCTDSEWANFGGMGTIDMLLEEAGNYARAKGRGWTTSGTTDIHVINEPLLSPKMKRYMPGICSDPVRCAVAAKIEASGSDGRYPRIDYPSDTWFCQNNFFRVYLDKTTGEADLHFDSAVQGNYSNFLWETSSLLLGNLITTEFEPEAELPFVECEPLEEAGATASIRQRLEFRKDNESMGEFRDFMAEADNPWLRIRVQRVFLGCQTRRRATTTLHLPGYQPQDKIGIDCCIRLSPPDGKPPLAIYIDPCDQIESVAWKQDGRLEITLGEAESHDFRMGLHIGAEDVAENQLQEDADRSARFCAQDLEFDWKRREQEHLAVANPTDEELVRAVRILNPPDGPFIVCEDGWWQPRGAQTSWEQRGTNLVKVVLPPRGTTKIAQSGLIDGLVKNGWGCQYTQLIRDIESIDCGAAFTVRVVDVGPMIWAPRLTFGRSVAKVSLDGRDWHYFDASHVFLPNRRGDYKLQVTFGPASTPHVVCTFSVVDSTQWDGNRLSVKTSLPEWCEDLPAEAAYYMVVRGEHRKLAHLESAQVVRDVPNFEAAKPMPMCGPDGVAMLVPRDYNHPPLDGYKFSRAHTISYVPPKDVGIVYET